MYVHLHLHLHVCTCTYKFFPLFLTFKYLQMLSSSLVTSSLYSWYAVGKTVLRRPIVLNTSTTPSLQATSNLAWMFCLLNLTISATLSQGESECPVMLIEWSPSFGGRELDVVLLQLVLALRHGGGLTAGVL